MFTKKDSLAILAIASIFACFDVGSSVKHEFITHNLTYGEFIQDIDFFANPGLVYGSCHDIETHGYNFQAKCTFVMETNQQVDSEGHLRFCDYKLNTKVNYDENLQLKRVVALNQDIAVAIFESYETFRYFVLHFSDPCKGFRVDNDENFKAMVYAPQYDQFELISTEGYRQCKDNRRCRLVMNMQGRVEEVNQGWLHYDQGYLVAITPPRYGEQLVVDKYENSVRLYAADLSGMIRLLKEYRINGRYEDKVLASMTYNYASLCSESENILSCSQFDSDGHLIFKRDFVYHQFAALNVQRIHNLPGGGLLVVITSCSPNNPKYCIEYTDNFHVTKIDSRGKLSNTIKINKPARVFINKLHLYQNHEKNVCLSHVFNNWKSSDSTVVDVFTFTPEDFNEIFENRELH